MLLRRARLAVPGRKARERHGRGWTRAPLASRIPVSDDYLLTGWWCMKIRTDRAERAGEHDLRLFD